VISNAANGQANVKALVYVAAFAPDAGETAGDLNSKFPGSVIGPALAPPVPLPGKAEALPVPDQSQDAVTSIFLFHELPPKVRRSVFRECARVLKPGGVSSSLQHGDLPDYDGLLDVFPESYHEPNYRSYLDEEFGAIAESCGLAHVRDVNAFISKVMVFDKTA